MSETPTLPINTDEIKSYRNQIDSIDEQIQTLINERAKIAQKIAIAKKNHEDHPIFYRPEREAQVLKAVMARNEGPLSGEKMARLFREIMSVCLELEAPQKVAYLGPVGTFTHAAALKHFGKAATTVSLATITDVFREVESGSAMYGVVPVENSSEGVVNHTLDAFLGSSLKIIGEVGIAGATYKTAEFCGETIEKMGVEGRATICNMAIEMGAKNGIMEPNKEVIQYVSQRTGKKESELNIVKSDEDAQYSEEMHFDITDMEPQIACPNDVDNVKDISKVEGTAVDQCLIGSCTNGRLSDLKDTYEILKDNEINNDTRLLILPASAEIYKQAIHEGYIDAFIDAGAIICNPGCGPCLGGHMGVLSEGETCISTTNRNFKGRMGDPKSSVYLANSKVVAASAIEGVITNPKDL